MTEKLTENQLLWRIKLIVIFFIWALILSGITAFPLEIELQLLCTLMETNIANYQSFELYLWLNKISQGISYTHLHYPFMAYGTDWLAFAHIIIAIAFVGVYFKPVRNIWIIYWAIIACIAVIPLALICGSIREIPLYWRLIDCSFGIFGVVPLIVLIKYVNQLAKTSGCYVPTKY